MDVKQPIPGGVPGGDGKEKFMTSQQVAFYRRQTRGPRMQFQALLDTLVLTEKGARFEVLEPGSQTKLLACVSPCKNHTVRMVIDELEPIKARYRVQDVLTQEPQCERLRVVQRDGDSATISWALGRDACRVRRLPFGVEILCEGQVVVTFNPQSKLWFEALRGPPEAPAATEPEEDNQWRETFRTFVDIKANGPSSIGADLRLHGYQHVYGVPEHADSLRLADTRDDEPYRLYNLDVFAYELNSHLGLYGSVPFLVAHRPERTVGVFWMNSSDTFVHINYNGGEEKDDNETYADAHWLSESGVIDCMVLLGPQPRQMYRQYAQLTGYQALPPLFTLGYHHSRWDNDTEEDLKAVDAGFDRHNIPYDVMWLDIEHTDQKRFFTWNSELFPDPARLQRHLQEKNRKMVAIIDPPIMVDPDWSIYREGRDGGHFIKDREGQIFKGNCWPGESSYPDFSNPRTRAWYSSCFALDRYKGSTPSLHAWLDMNEPTVFSGPELTLPKNAMHYGGWEHRDLHNLYGFYQQLAAMEGLVTRSGGTERPFVLSRAFFAGSQRLGAVWSGDNLATWGYLKISIPMCLSTCVAGLSFCGADVGGFIPEPDLELLIRWYQTASLQPFFRGHSSMNTRRREPWLFEETATNAIQRVIEDRYRLLPYWYTLFYRAHIDGLPVLRPLWMEFPKEPSIFSVDHQYMLGDALMACPVTEAAVREIPVILPGAEQVWYDVESAEALQGGKTISVPVTLDTIPVYQRGGSVVCRAAGVGTCTADLQEMPLSITVALDSEGGAKGEVYLDDGHSFAYRDKKEFCLRSFHMLSGHLRCRAGEEGNFDRHTTVQSVTVLGVKSKPSSVVVHVPGAERNPAEFEYNEERGSLALDGLKLSVAKDWDIEIC
ncbi:neutral alpha-glucosidase C [Entelurus aequoreus]|uniref:neutral alpha-glucosidase C n=1 Tax=Entelurus aequoreus TaxID=161455 RepID=UPI002B1E32AE|nr:neutral alpha-glucosidase C [Entelurus aequoreus]